jgi:DNA-damage-inducible protein F
LTGAALGAGSARHARSVGSKVVMYSTIFSAFLALVFAAGAGVIPRVFTSSQEVIDAMSQPWWILVGMVIAGGVVFALDGVLLGAGDAAFLRSLTIASVLLGFLPGVLLAHAMGTGLTGVWCGLAAFISFRLTGVVYRFYSMKWAVIAE